MARVKLDLPEYFLFKTRLSVRISEINYGGHLGNDAVLSLVHEARYRFLNSLGYANEISLENTTGLIVADAVLVYKAEVFHGDFLDIHVGVDDFNPYGFDMFYYLENVSAAKEVSRVKTGIVCLDYEKKRLTKTPDEFIRRLRELEGYPI